MLLLTFPKALFTGDNQFLVHMNLLCGKPVVILGQIKAGSEGATEATFKRFISALDVVH